MGLETRLIDRVSAASTFMVLGGIGVLFLIASYNAGGSTPVVAKPSQHLSVASLASLTRPEPANGALTLVRAKSVPVTDIVISEGPGEVLILAAQKKASKTARSEEGAPDTAWDGKPIGQSKPAEPVKPAKDGTPPASPVAAPEPAAIPVPVAEDTWSASDVAEALKECVKLLGPVAAQIEPADAMRKGPCGSPAPVRLKSVGLNEKVEFTPPIEVNCKLAVALAGWIEKSLQPAAKELVNSRVTRISGASGYQCRNRYGQADAPLSEHALANAVDIPSFVLADGRSVKVLGTWGPTARDIAASKAAIAAASEADAKAGKSDAKTSGNASGKTGSAKPTGQSDGESGQASKSAAAKPVKAEKTEGKSKTQKVLAKSGANIAVKIAGIGKLGAGDALPVLKEQAPPAAPVKLSAEGRLLHRLAKEACGLFGTVLGPEANEAHRDHFHFDVKARRNKAYCQ